MTTGPTNVAVLGSTGSIGRSTLEVVAASQGRLRAVALTANRSTGLLFEQACAIRPRWVVVTDDGAARRQDWSGLPRCVEVLTGPDAIQRVAAHADVDLVVSAIVGSAGLHGTWAALEAGKTVALANKESLVVAGPLVTRLAQERHARILPVDSEHSAVFQALQAGRREELKRIILTASGGPFRTYSQEQLARVTVAEALDHPTWNMGPKVTIDSATLMNKAMEIIEARWLFDLAPDQIAVMIHPQSIVHSLVEFIDGSVVAQMSPPDMKLPIHYALSWPERRESVAEKIDWGQMLHLDFFPPDAERFGALRLGQEVARAGGTAGAVLNAANETAVAAFLAGELSFCDIVTACQTVLENHEFDPSPTLEKLLAIDAWARQETLHWVSN
jgi:1-deoxy-D-xylulose-5-phosphate reductoisomerase